MYVHVHMEGEEEFICTCTAQTLKPLKLLVKFWHSLFPIFASELLLLLKNFFFRVARVRRLEFFG